MSCSCGDTGRCPKCGRAHRPVPVLRALHASGGLKTLRQEAEARRRTKEPSTRRQRHEGEVASLISRDLFGRKPGREGTRCLIALVEAENGRGPLLAGVPAPSKRKLIADCATGALDAIDRAEESIASAHRCVAERRHELLAHNEQRAAKIQRTQARSVMRRTERTLTGLQLTDDEWEVLAAELRREPETSPADTTVVPIDRGDARSRLDRRDQVLGLLPDALHHIGRLIDIIDPSGIEAVPIRYAVGASLAKCLKDAPPVPGEVATAPASGGTGQAAA